MATNTGTAVPSKQEEKKHHGFWFDLFRRLIREKPLGTFGLVIVIILFISWNLCQFSCALWHERNTPYRPSEATILNIFIRNRPTGS